MGTLLSDLRFGLRLLLKNPALTAVAAASLALGIGANTTIFTLVGAVLLNPLPMKDPERLVAVFTTDVRNRGTFFNYMSTSRQNFEDYHRSNTVFSGLVAFNGIPLNLADGRAEPEQVFGEIVSGDFFDVLGVRPVVGRGFLPDEDQTPGSAPVAVLSYNLWQRRFGGDAGIVGRTIPLNGHPFTVVGVAPRGFKGANTIGIPALWVPMMSYPQVATGFFAENFDSRRALLFGLAGRLKPGVTLEQAQSSLSTLASQLERDFPDDNGGRSVALLPLAEATINPGLRDNMVLAGKLLMGVVGLVLLIACANVANLLLARAAVRQREVAVRLALGASRGRLLRQLLTEGLILAALGGTLALLLAYWAQAILWANRPPGLAADALDLHPDARVLGFTLLVSLLTAVLFGLAPALRASRPDLVDELKQRGGPSVGGNRPFALRNLLVVGQVALSLVALVGAGLFVRSLQNAQRVDPGFDYQKLAVLTVDLGAQGYDEARGREFHRQMLERALAQPGVERATLATGIPLFQGSLLRTVFTEGVDTTDRRNGKLVQLNTVEPGYLDTLGIALRRGRALESTDTEASPHVVVVNETMAQQFWPGQEAIGKRFKFYGQDWWNEVVGVAADGKYNFLGEDPQPHIYLSLRQVYDSAVSLHIRAGGDPAPTLSAVRQAVQQMEPRLPITNVLTFEEILSQALWAPRMGAFLLGTFAFLSLLLAVVGLYGVMSYSVSQRRREMGIRVALGAARSDVLRLVVSQGLALALAGILAGLALSLGVTRLVVNLLYGVGAYDPVAFVGVPLVLAAAAVLACALPAWRAGSVDPTEALRSE